jgi:hypothetical protein
MFGNIGQEIVVCSAHAQATNVDGDVSLSENILAHEFVFTANTMKPPLDHA